MLDTGTGTNALGGAQIYIGHGGKGTVTVDGGNKGKGEIMVTDGATLTLGTKDVGATYVYVGENAGSTCGGCKLL